jgi:NCS1 family nucleobase:cation symporter-1
VIFTDQVLRRAVPSLETLYDRRHRNWAGPIAMLAGMGVSIWLFSDQAKYVGPVPKHHPAVGDITFEVGFVVTAVVYAALVWSSIRSARPSPRH